MCFFDGDGRNILRGGKWGTRGREAGGEGEGSGGKGEGKRGLGTPLSTPTYKIKRVQRAAANDGPKGSLHFHNNSEFRILNSKFRISQ